MEHLYSTYSNSIQDLCSIMADDNNNQSGSDMLDDSTAFGAEPYAFLEDLLDFDADLETVANGMDWSEFDYAEPDEVKQELVNLSTELETLLSNNDSTSSDPPLIPSEWMIMDRKSRRHRPPLLFEFLILLLDKSHYSSYASFTDSDLGVFQFHQPDKVAALWERIKNRKSEKDMTYDKMARAIRWYYKSGIMIKTNARYTFQFAPETLKKFYQQYNTTTMTNVSCIKE